MDSDILDPLTVDEVKVDFSMFAPGPMLDLVKVDEVTTEYSMLESVNVLCDISEFVHVDLIEMFPFPVQLPEEPEAVNRYKIWIITTHE